MYCPTERMIVDYNTKPLVGGKFKIFQDLILILNGIRHSQIGQQECVGDLTKKAQSHVVCAVTFICVVHFLYDA